MTSRETLAVLGAGGTMGLPMTRNLARIGFIVRAWNRSPEKAQSLADDGAELAERHGLQFVDAPVLGTKRPAEQGELVVLASGPEELEQDARPVGAPPTTTASPRGSAVPLPHHALDVIARGPIGWRADVRYVPSSENRSSGSSLGSPSSTSLRATARARP